MTAFVLPAMQPNPEGWGPLPHFQIAGLENIPIESLTKSERVARVADFTQNATAARRDRRREDDEEFTLVDTKPAPRPAWASRGRGRGRGRGFGQWRPWDRDQPVINPRTGKPYPAGQQPTQPGKGLKGSWPGKSGSYTKGFGKGGFSKGKGKGKGFGRGGKQLFREWSVPVNAEWPVTEEIQLTSFNKLSADPSQVSQKDVQWCGQLHQYDKSFDRITPKLEKPLQRFENTNFYNVTAREDPVVESLMEEDGENIDVVVTDFVLAALMASSRSSYSWDIVVSKAEGTLIFDKRDGSHLDFLTVNETSQDPPSNDDKDSINAPMKLGLEASSINQNFSQQVLNQKIPPVKMENENPFEDEEERGQAASVAYRYQKITLPGNPKGATEHAQKPVTMLVRSEVDCLMPESTDEKRVYGSVKALNEYQPKASQSWRNCVESQRGAVLATELKNNSYKLGRWTAQALVGGIHVMKFGYVTRQSPNDSWRQSILTVQTYKTADFAKQIGMSPANIWGVVRYLVDTILAQPDGKYLLLKDPAKPVLRLYDIPWETFEEDEEDEWEGEEEKEEK